MSCAERLARELLAACSARGVMLATAESCTGGMIAAELTAIPGSSSVVDRGFVTYSNAAKVEMLGVRPTTLDTHGAVSPETAVEMAVGALEYSRAGIALSVTGIAGPGGGSPEKPVGLVWFGVAARNGLAETVCMRFPDEGREAIRRMAVEKALELCLGLVERLQATTRAP